MILLATDLVSLNSSNTVASSWSFMWSVDTLEYNEAIRALFLSSRDVSTDSTSSNVLSSTHLLLYNIWHVLTMTECDVSDPDNAKWCRSRIEQAIPSSDDSNINRLIVLVKEMITLWSCHFYNTHRHPCIDRQQQFSATLLSETVR